MIVVLMHFSNLLSAAAPQTSEFLSHGYLGVDIFFIISGFIIYIATENPQSRQSSSFFVRRFCRVVLPAWAAILLAAMTQPPYLSDLAKSVFFIPLKNADAPFYGYSTLIVAWTLTYELVFYLVFAAVLSFKAGREHRGLIACGVLAAMVALARVHDCCSFDVYASPLFMIADGHFPGQLISLLGNPMLLEFGIGIFFAWVYVNGGFGLTFSRTFLVLSPVTLFFLLKYQYVAGHGITRGGLVAVLIVCFVLCLQGWADTKGSRTAPVAGRFSLLGVGILFLGEISYSLYLVHPSVKALMRRATNRHWLEIGASWEFIMAVGCSIGLAVLFYRWIELPAQRLGRALAERHREKQIFAPI